MKFFDFSSSFILFQLDLSKIKPNKIFSWIKAQNVSDDEMLKTFNCGIGLLVYVDKQNSSKLLNHLNSLNFNSWIVGEMQQKDKNQNSVHILNYE